MSDHDWGCSVTPGVFNYYFGKGLVDRDVPRLPSVMDRGVYVGVIRRVPHVVLQEPQQGVAEYVVKFVVDAPGRNYVAKVDFVSWKRRFQTRRQSVVGDGPVAFPHGAGHPGKLRGLDQEVECGDHAAAATTPLGAAFRGHLVFHRSAVAGQKQGPLRKHPIAKLLELCHVVVLAGRLPFPVNHRKLPILRSHGRISDKWSQRVVIEDDKGTCIAPE